MKKNTLLYIFLCANIANTKNIDLENKYDFHCPEKKIAVIMASYNNKKYYKKNLDSLRNQNYQNYYAIYINDYSKDNTGILVEDYIKEYNLTDKIIYINNTERAGPLANIYKAIHSCDNDTIVVILDGDDTFAHNNVLKVINSCYQDPDIWMTYGQYIYMPEKRIIRCTRYSQEDIKNNNFRKRGMHVSHPRTFYAGLFKLIKLEDLLYKGEFYPMSQDKATIMPIIEMTGHRHKYISDILYLYNNANPLNLHKTHNQLQQTLKREIRNKKPYEPVTWEDIINA